MNQNGEIKEIFPEGVELRDFSDFGALRKQIFDGAKEELTKKFPYTQGNYRFEVDEVDYDGPEEFSIKEQKQALLKGSVLSRRLRGRIKMFDNTTNELVEQKKLTFMNVPYMTNRGTFVHNGNEYTTINQFRLEPGIYTRKKRSGEFEAHINPKRGAGASMRIRFEPESALYKLDMEQSSMKLYPILRSMGITDEQLEETWGKEILEKNRSEIDPAIIDKLYTKLLRYKAEPTANLEEKAEAIKKELKRSRFKKEIVTRTLPNFYMVKEASEKNPESSTTFNKLDYQVLAEIFRKAKMADIPHDQKVSEIASQLRNVIKNNFPKKVNAVKAKNMKLSNDPQ